MLGKQRGVPVAHVFVDRTVPFDIHVGSRGASTVVHLKGRVDIDSSPDLRDRLLVLLQATSPTAITLELEEVPYMDTSGIATLIEALKVARHREVALCLQGLVGSVRRLFEVTGVLALFETKNCQAGPQVH